MLSSKTLELKKATEMKTAKAAPEAKASRAAASKERFNGLEFGWPGRRIRLSLFWGGRELGETADSRLPHYNR